MNNISEEFINSTLTLSAPVSFYDCLKGIHFGFIFSYCVGAFCFLVGTPANSWCLWYYFWIEQKDKQIPVFLLNHIIIELIYCLECLAEMLNILIVQNNKFSKVLHFFFFLTWSGRPLMQICICIEQYLAVLHPVTFLRYKAIKYRIAAAVAVWLMSLGYSVFQFTTIAFPDPVINFVFILTLAVISFCCVSLLRALKHPGPGEKRTRGQTGRDVGNQQKRNAFHTIFLSLLLILFTYIPQVLLIIFTSLRVDVKVLTCEIAPVVLSFNVFGVMATPIRQKYKEGYLQCLRKK